MRNPHPKPESPKSQQKRFELCPIPEFRHSIATIQLDQEEAACYRNVPVVLDFRSGFYVFPVRTTFFYFYFIIVKSL